MYIYVAVFSFFALGLAGLIARRELLGPGLREEFYREHSSDMSANHRFLSSHFPRYSDEGLTCQHIMYIPGTYSYLVNTSR